jgi:signal transduction histidine kinase
MEDEIRFLNQRIEILERELQTTRQLVLFGIQSSIWNHRLNNAARTIRENVYLIAHYLKTKDDIQKIENCLDRIAKSVDRILSVPDIPQLSSLDVPSIQVDKFLAECKSQLQEHYKDIQITIKNETMPQTAVRANPEWLHRCLDIFVDNAVRAMQGSPEKILKLITTAYKGTVEISISNTGIGIPENVQHRLFREPIRDSDEQNKVGFGLLLAQTIIQVYGGKIELKKTSNQGTEFVVSLPTETIHQQEEQLS